MYLTPIFFQNAYTAFSLDRNSPQMVVYPNKIIFILEPPPYFPQVVWSEQIAGNIALLSGSEGRWLRKGAASG